VRGFSAAKSSWGGVQVWPSICIRLAPKAHLDIVLCLCLLGLLWVEEVGGLLVGSMGSSMPGAGRLNPLEE
jgi:hypothetical protein